MIAQRKQMLEKFVPVQALVQEHPLVGPLSYGGAPETLDDVVPRVREYAGAQIEPESDVRMPAAIKMPRAGVGVTKILQACDGMIAAARLFEAA